MTSSDTMPTRSRIFLSYRREDAEYPVGRLAEDLRKHFPRDQVFQDIASIDPGADFVEALQEALDTCAAVLVVIGPRWLTLADHEGRRRLDLPDDWVRHEIVESLRRPGVRVFPVLLDAEMPSAEDLPEDIKPLTRRQAFPLTGRHWAKDVAELVEFLKKVPGLAARGPAGAPPQAKVSWKLVTAVAALLVLATALFVFFIRGERSEPPRATAPAAKSTPAPEMKPPTEPAVRMPESTAKTTITTLKAGEAFRDCDQCPEMVVILGGSFTMRSPRLAIRAVTIARPFGVGKYEVTFDEWDACVAARGCAHKPGDEGWGRGRRPVMNVSWEDAQAYVSWLGNKTGKPYRLPSEAEWEYACRAKTDASDPAYDKPFTGGVNFANSGTQWSDKQTAPVGSFEPNAFGLYDAIGNVSEWVQDCQSLEGAPADGRAWEAGECRQRITRGGDWGSGAYRICTGIKGGNPPGDRQSLIGFRVARDL